MESAGQIAYCIISRLCFCDLESRNTQWLTSAVLFGLIVESFVDLFQVNNFRTWLLGGEFQFSNFAGKILNCTHYRWSQLFLLSLFEPLPFSLSQLTFAPLAELMVHGCSYWSIFRSVSRVRKWFALLYMPIYIQSYVVIGKSGNWYWGVYKVRGKAGFHVEECLELVSFSVGPALSL